MSFITISRGSFSGCREFSEQLAAMLDYQLVYKEFLNEKAKKIGIPVEKLEFAVKNPPRVRQPLGKMRDIYLAFMKYEMCQLMLKKNVIYCGNMGQILMEGLPHIFRLRILADMEYRIKAVGSMLNMERDKAKKYIEKMDTERDNWINFLYGIKRSDPILYDFTINLSEMKTETTVKAVGSIFLAGKKSEFEFDAEAVRNIKNLMLKSHVRVLLGMDKRTQNADVRISANDGVVDIVLTPIQADLAAKVYEVLADVEGCKEVTCTIANTNILWIQEKFDIKTETFRDMVDIAKKWDAAVEIRQWKSSTKPEQESTADSPEGQDGALTEQNTYESQLYAQTNEVMDELVKDGYAGGGVAVKGSNEQLFASIDDPKKYSLVVVDNLFLSKSPSARKRMILEFKSALFDHFNIPVIESKELKQKVKFSLKDLLKVCGRIAVALAMFFLVFLNQERVIEFLSGKAYEKWRILAIVVVVLFVPTFAYVYGTTMKTILKYFKID